MLDHSPRRTWPALDYALRWITFVLPIHVVTWMARVHRQGGPYDDGARDPKSAVLHHGGTAPPALAHLNSLIQSGTSAFFVACSPSLCKRESDCTARGPGEERVREAARVSSGPIVSEDRPGRPRRPQTRCIMPGSEAGAAAVGLPGLRTRQPGGAVCPRKQYILECRPYIRSCS